MTSPRAIFFGTPAFAVPSLEALCDVAEVTLVICQPDRKSGRGMRLTAPPVKEAALARGIPVLQPRKVRTPDFAARLREENADVNVVVAYGRILPLGVLESARYGSVNVHASLLPELRGAAPVQWAVMRGHRQSGISLMKMDEGMDTGAVLATQSTDIGPDETAAELSQRLSMLGAQLLCERLPHYLAGELRARPQDDARATSAPPLRKEDGLVDWAQRAQQVHDLVRGTQPWPGAYSFVDDTRVKLWRTRVLEATGTHGAAGTVLATGTVLEVACGEGRLGVEELQPDGSRRMHASDFCAGRRVTRGARFTRGMP